LVSARIVLSWLIKAALLAVAFAVAPPAAVFAGMAAWAIWHAIPKVLPPLPQPQSGDPRAQALQLRAATYARAAGIAHHAHVSLDGPAKPQLMTVTHRRRRTLAVIVPRNSPVLDFPLAAQDAELRRRIALLGRPWRTWTMVWLTRIVPTGVRSPTCFLSRHGRGPCAPDRSLPRFCSGEHLCSSACRSPGCCVVPNAARHAEPRDSSPCWSPQNPGPTGVTPTSDVRSAGGTTRLSMGHSWSFCLRYDGLRLLTRTSQMCRSASPPVERSGNLTCLRGCVPIQSCPRDDRQLGA
jgi:hypothetical protein